MPPGDERHRPHGADAWCAAGAALYARALRERRVPARDAERAPCLVDFGLLHPDLDDMAWLLPSAPSRALLRLLRGIEEDVAHERRREAELTAAFEPLLALARRAAERTAAPAPPDRGAPPRSSAITLLRGVPRITDAVCRAADTCADEVLTVQPGGFHRVWDLGSAPPREQPLLSRGCRLRTLYQHTARHAFPVLARFEELAGDVEVRTLSEVTAQLVVFDRAVAFVPADRDRALALEIRVPALARYLAALFDRLWRLATPLFPHPAPQPARDGVTARQRAIAELLTEGLTDAGIAERLGMNVRTVRVHISKLAEVLGSTGRTQLGYRIGQSGLLGPTDPGGPRGSHGPGRSR
ncbi:helix-turn-helix transcriptional regulator [Streptomyces sp. AN091965]|uniref:helix-turn-helix transcriptional regulator n=1 Tax=Streptomyces sp. AN091965 TaxID=2927803 RepID=UPI001F618369|nr:LuxR C-terminal-related transcriptional regulator [Streptomyces sp. AN091965]MCI3931992.1 LuxR C-terminal-related transcriptional regulator [Streptomyces sp. AN091965]